MSLKEDLLSKGYFPENLPPSFTSEQLASYLSQQRRGSYLMNSSEPLRAATYNASKRGLSRRIFSVVHPVTGHDMAEFIDTHWRSIREFYGKSELSFSIPEHDTNAIRALAINSHLALEKEKISRLSSRRFIATTDISRFYHSIYTHSIPWAFHGKHAAKADQDYRSATVFFNQADALVRNGQDGQTLGLPVGPDASRALAELIGTAIDIEFMHRRDEDRIDCTVIRHVDDVWIGADSRTDVERALSRYREAIRIYELDVNENKTGIFAKDFRFSDSWPSEVLEQIRRAAKAPETQVKNQLRSALEHVFGIAVRLNDDGVAKFVLRSLDRNRLTSAHWDVVEPFLKRLTVHFGHTLDYVVRILIWRHLIQEDVDITAWSPIVNTILSEHAELGNDSEVCWTIYAYHFLGITINHDNATRIVRHCGSLALVALLNCVDSGNCGGEILEDIWTRLRSETDSGRHWPIFLEWKAKQLPRYKEIRLTNPTIENLCSHGARIYDSSIRPLVFHDKGSTFGEVPYAIETRSGIYSQMDEEDREAF